MKRYFAIALTLLILLACTNRGTNATSKSITVTIPPIKGIVQEIVGEEVNINILLPEGTTPESYSPTISQLIGIQDSDAIFSTGTLSFEELITNEIAQHIGNKLFSINKGVDVIEGHCSHSDAHNDEHHHHGHDPHIWLSLDNLTIIAQNIGDSLLDIYPDDSVRIKTNTAKLIDKIEKTDQECRSKLTGNTFLIYHPALGYLAKDYSLKQIALENDGKSPTPSTVINIVDIVKDNGIQTLLYQKEYPLDVIKPLAEILDVKPIIINPLHTDIVGEIERIVNIISTGDEGGRNN